MAEIIGKFPLTEEECLRIGGHCYKVSDYVVDTLPPIYHRVCKHCGHIQHGVEQPKMKWTDTK